VVAGLHGLGLARRGLDDPAGPIVATRVGVAGRDGALDRDHDAVRAGKHRVDVKTDAVVDHADVVELERQLDEQGLARRQRGVTAQAARTSAGTRLPRRSRDRIIIRFLREARPASRRTAQ
jgi:hypothetical protein